LLPGASASTSRPTATSMMRNVTIST
jgi:hypothetical protein